MNPLAEALDRVVADLDAVLSAAQLAGLDDAARLDVLRGAGEALRRVEAVVVETTASAEPRFAEATGCRSMNELLQRVLRVDAPGASRVVKATEPVRREMALTTGERLPARFPAIREAMLDGVIGVAGVLAASGPILQAGDRIGAEDRISADAALADLARGLPEADGGAEGGGPPATPDDLRQYAMLLAQLLDPDGAEPTDAKARNRRFLTIGRLRNGVHPLRGNLLPDVAAQLQLIIDAQNNPKTRGNPKTPGNPNTDGRPEPGVTFRSESERSGDGAESGADVADADPWNSDPRNVIEQRTAAQKRHDAVAAALAIAARHEDMPRLAGASPTLVVHADADDLVSGTGWATVAGSQSPVPIGVATQAACTGAIQRVLFDHGRIVGTTVTDRVFTVHQRRAIIARDGECLIPGCHVPASWCEIPHVVEHATGGPTDTDNGVPLCWWHHRSLDRSGWEIRMAGGTPQVRGPAWWDPERRWRVPRQRETAAA